MKTFERIGPYEVHPVASIFPMMSEKESLELGMSISDIGLQEPIVVHEGMLVDGRNRAKQCLEIGVPIRTVEWSKVVAHNHARTGKGGLDDFPATTVDQWIMAKNIARRSLTEDQRAALWIEYNLWQAEEEARENQKAAQFEKGKSGNPTGKAAEQVNMNSCEPAKAKDYHKTSTVGKVAAAAKVSHHKAAQVVKLVKAVEAGTAPKEDLEAVKAGRKKLKDAVKPLVTKTKRVPNPQNLEKLERKVAQDASTLIFKHRAERASRLLCGSFLGQLAWRLANEEERPVIEAMRNRLLSEGRGQHPEAQ